MRRIKNTKRVKVKLDQNGLYAINGDDGYDRGGLRGARKKYHRSARKPDARKLIRTMSMLVTLGTIFTIVAGCAARAKNITGAPSGVTQAQVQNWDAAVANLQKIAATTTTLRQAVIALNKAGAFPDGSAYAGTLAGVGRIDELQIAAAKFLSGVPNDWSATTQATVNGYVTQIQAILTNLTASGVVGIKNPQSQQQVTALINEIGAAASIIISLT